MWAFQVETFPVDLLIPECVQFFSLRIFGHQIDEKNTEGITEEGEENGDENMVKVCE